MEMSHIPVLWQQTSSAGFIFKVTSTGETVYVYARNRYAVCCLEKFSMPRQNNSHICTLESVLVDCKSVPIVYPKAREIPYTEFVLNFIDRRILMSDVVVFNCFGSSLDADGWVQVKKIISKEKADKEKADKEKAVVSNRDIFRITTDSPIFAKSYEAEIKHTSHRSKPNETVLKALQGLGYSKQSVNSWASEYDSSGKSNGDMVKAGCKMIAQKAS